MRITFNFEGHEDEVRILAKCPRLGDEIAGPDFGQFWIVIATSINATAGTAVVTCKPVALPKMIYGD